MFNLTREYACNQHSMYNTESDYGPFLLSSDSLNSNTTPPSSAPGFLTDHLEVRQSIKKDIIFQAEKPD